MTDGSRRRIGKRSKNEVKRHEMKNKEDKEKTFEKEEEVGKRTVQRRSKNKNVEGGRGRRKNR